MPQLPVRVSTDTHKDTIMTVLAHNQLMPSLKCMIIKLVFGAPSKFPLVELY